MTADELQRTMSARELTERRALDQVQAAERKRAEDKAAKEAARR